MKYRESQKDKKLRAWFVNDNDHALVQNEQIKLQRVTAELEQKQIEQIKMDELERKKADIRIVLTREGNNFQFHIKNFGRAKAQEVWVTLGDESNDNPLLPDEYKRKIPIPFLSPGGEVSLIALIHLGSSGQYTMNARWINEDDTQSKKDFFLSI